MFDLEKAVADWRKRMLDAGFKDPKTLGELETHLREDIEQQLNAGSTPKTAFDAAILRIGQPVDLRKEFRKTRILAHLIARAKNTALTFSGIPNHYLSMNDSSSNIESRWATYFRSAAFLLPAFCVWMF